MHTLSLLKSIHQRSHRKAEFLPTWTYYWFEFNLCSASSRQTCLPLLDRAIRFENASFWHKTHNIERFVSAKAEYSPCVQYKIRQKIATSLIMYFNARVRDMFVRPEHCLTPNSSLDGSSGLNFRQRWLSSTRIKYQHSQICINTFVERPSQTCGPCWLCGSGRSGEAVTASVCRVNLGRAEAVSASHWPVHLSSVSGRSALSQYRSPPPLPRELGLVLRRDWSSYHEWLPPVVGSFWGHELTTDEMCRVTSGNNGTHVNDCCCPCHYFWASYDTIEPANKRLGDSHGVA